MFKMLDKAHYKNPRFYQILGIICNKSMSIITVTLAPSDTSKPQTILSAQH